MSEFNEPRRPAPPSRSGGRRQSVSGSRSAEGGQRAMPRRRTRRRPVAVTILIRLLQLVGTLLLIGVITGSFLICYAAFYVKTVITPQTVQTVQTVLDLSAYTLNENSKLYYTDKETGLYVELATLVGEKNSEWVDLEDIPDDLINAVIAIEDKRFHNHNGVDWKRTGYAVLHMFLGMDSTVGGSTITQQLIKNVTQYDDVTVTRKIREIFTALELEKNYTKEEILELYLNAMFMGNRCWGVQSAAQTYFGKDVSELTLAECACLAGITNNPSLYGPNSDLRVARYKCRMCGEFTNNTKPDECPDCGAKSSFGEPEIWTARDYNKRRQKIILNEMLKGDEKEGIEPSITQAEYNRAVAEPLNFVDSDGGPDEEDGKPDSVRYSWYVETVISEVLDDLQAQTGLDRRTVNRLVYNGGLSIYTNFDPDVQAVVDQVYSDPDNLGKGKKTSKDGYPIKSAITVVDNSTGAVVALAGDLGPKVGDLINNYATMPHQPGSSFKPISTYAPALDMKLITPGTTIDDNPMIFNGKVGPRNENNPYRGLMSVQEGVAKSLNTIAVRTLQLVTPEKSFEYLTERFGITTLIEGKEIKGEWKTDIGYSPLALGGPTYGITTFEAAAAFASFPRNGVFTEPTTYLRIEDRNHQTLLDNTPRTEEVIKPETAYYMNNLLSNAVQVGTGTPAKISGMSVAGKTGTTNDSFARWFSGYTPYYTACVWVGYQYNRTIEGFGTNPAVHIWREVMAQLNEGKENIGFPKPAGVETVTRSICQDCGLLAGEGCESDIRGSEVRSYEFVKGDEPVETCTCHVPIEICVDSPILDGNGEPTNYYHLASEFCPEESRKTVYLVDYERELVTEASAIGDYWAMKSAYDAVNGEMTCDVHNEFWVDPGAEPTEPNPEDPNWSGEDPPWWWVPPTPEEPTETPEVTPEPIPTPEPSEELPEPLPPLEPSEP